MSAPRYEADYEESQNESLRAKVSALEKEIGCHIRESAACFEYEENQKRKMERLEAKLALAREALDKIANRRLARGLGLATLCGYYERSAEEALAKLNDEAK